MAVCFDSDDFCYQEADVAAYPDCVHAVAATKHGSHQELVAPVTESSPVTVVTAQHPIWRQT